MHGIRNLPNGDLTVRHTLGHQTKHHIWDGQFSNVILGLVYLIFIILLKRSLDKITINDIAEDCGINRMTFYYRFKDIYDLVEWSCVEDAAKALDGKKTKAVNVEFDIQKDKKTAKRVTVLRDGKEDYIDLTEDDLIFITNGGCVENSSIGSRNKPVVFNKEIKEGGGWDMWRKIAAQDPSFGHPDKFCYDPEQSKLLKEYNVI